ncbi:hypothetical protein SXIM_50660 [Streptomyces xiamenensis]|uniref:Uncharacterized protein n=1 Tax=Streptomyces xiamenensis TaxID=408015 RepID=A0A0F7G1U0_9ACTN|nr:hypothetical protein SXIM_50660 [Streptomyces xiamenensis]
MRELLRHSGYRGPEYVDLGARIAVGGVLDPHVVADAARTGDHDPQALKKVWHRLARFGAPGTAAGQTARPAPARGAVLDGPGGAAGPAG